MKPDLVLEYNIWAERGYVTPLQCPSDDLDLFPTRAVDHLLLHCPKCNYTKQLGLLQYSQLEKKLAMAKFLFERQK